MICQKETNIPNKKQRRMKKHISYAAMTVSAVPACAADKIAAMPEKYI